MITRLPLKVQIVDISIIDIIRVFQRKTPIARVTVAGIDRTANISVISISFSKNFVPVCILNIAKIADADLFSLDDSLIVELGYKLGIVENWFRAFTGTIGQRKRKYSGQSRSFNIENKGMTAALEDPYDPCDPPPDEESGTVLTSATVFTGLQQGSLFLKWKNDVITRDVLTHDPGSCATIYESQEIELPTGHIDCINGRWQNVPFYFPTFSTIQIPVVVHNSYEGILFPGKSMQLNFATKKQAIDHARGLALLKDDECDANDPTNEYDWWETPEGEFILGSGGVFGGEVSYDGNAVYKLNLDVDIDNTENEGRFEIPYDPYVGLETRVTITDTPLGISDIIKVDSYSIDYSVELAKATMRCKGKIV